MLKISSVEVLDETLPLQFRTLALFLDNEIGKELSNQNNVSFIGISISKVKMSK